MKTHKPASLILNLGASLAVALLLPWPFLWSWLISINLFTIFAMARDKFAARLRITRVPERTLHTLTFAGGSLGMLFGRTLFNHKQRKAKFNNWLFVILTVHLGVVFLIVYYYTQLIRLFWMADLFI